MKKFFALLFALAILAVAACQKPDPLPLTADQIGVPPRATVLWISVDGLRHDYVARAHPPFIEKLSRTGAFSAALSPVFPTLTFPSHTTQVTGALTDAHGITGNSFWDSKLQKRFSFPDDENLRTAEPIWTTATRQKIRTAVYDWPLSQKQTTGAGKFPAAYFSNDSYDETLTDQDRLQRLVDAYQKDSATPPLRLLMGYVPSVDHVGHRAGPDSPEVDKTLLEVDTLLAHTVTSIQTTFNSRKSPGEHLYVLISTDHGMSTVHTLINPEILLDDPTGAAAKLDYSGPIANIFLTPGATAEKTAELAQKIRNRISNIQDHDHCAAVYLKSQLPNNWHYAHPTRTGDIVLVANDGYTFSTRPKEAAAPVKETLPSGETKTNGPLGMHGYPVESNPNCKGYMLLWTDAKPLGGINLGELSTTQLHATVCELLGIKPAPGADPHPIKLFP